MVLPTTPHRISHGQLARVGTVALMLVSGKLGGRLNA